MGLFLFVCKIPRKDLGSLIHSPPPARPQRTRRTSCDTARERRVNREPSPAFERVPFSRLVVATSATTTYWGPGFEGLCLLSQPPFDPPALDSLNLPKRSPTYWPVCGRPFPEAKVSALVVRRASGRARPGVSDRRTRARSGAVGRNFRSRPSVFKDNASSYSHSSQNRA